MRKLTEYEKRILASAYNIRNYCMNQECCFDCIFGIEKGPCLLSESDYALEPYAWELRKVFINLSGKEVGDKQC